MRALVVFLFLLCAARVARADDTVSEEARAHFKTGVALLRESTGPRYEEAYHAFKAAYRASPSPKILGNLGLCARMLERDGEAIDAYRRYLDEVQDIGDEERAGIENELVVLESSAVVFTLKVSPAEVTVIDERRPVQGLAVVNRYTPEQGVLTLRIRAGTHHLRVQHDGYAPAELTFDARPGEGITRTVRLEPIRHEVKKVTPVSVWASTPVIVSLTLTGLFGAGMAVSMGGALATHNAYEDARAARDVTRGDELREQGEALNITADVFMAATATAALVSLGLVLFLPTEEVRVSFSGNHAAVRVRF